MQADKDTGKQEGKLLNKLQRGFWLLSVAVVLALLPDIALAEPEGKVPDKGYPHRYR